MKIYFVEGADGSGKTTLIKNLCNACDKVVSFTPPPVDWNWDTQYNIWDDFLNSIRNSNQLNDIVLIDRSPITEFVYRMVIDKAHTYMHLSDLLTLMDDYKIEIVYCKNDKSYELAKDRGESYITDKETHSLICEMYEHFMYTLMMADFNVRLYNFETCSLTKTYNLLKEEYNAI